MTVFFSVLFSLIPSNNIQRVFLAKLNTLWFLLLSFVVFSMITNSSMNIRIDFYPLSLYMVFILIHNAFNHTLSSDWQIKYFHLKIEWNLSFEFPSLFLLRSFCLFSILEDIKTISILCYWFLVFFLAFIIMEVIFWTKWNNSQLYRFSNSTMATNRYIAYITYDYPAYLFITIHTFMTYTCKNHYLDWK